MTMTDQEAIEVLTALIKKEILNPAEREAVSVSIGVLALTNKVADSHIAAMKKKKSRDRSID